ncbi:MAG: N-6 DNA methylase [Candidatus Riflebacteria bacterium]|nr:N-6 DNA methylase [Candidatus Riflebacteria bacterium]
MLDYVINSTKSFLENMPKSERKKKGQFFTSKETAEFMANMFDFSNFKETISLLDPGAGTGILTAAFIDRALKVSNIKKIIITCYEKDTEVLEILNKNLEYLKNNSSIDLDYKIHTEDYLLSQSNDFEKNLLANENPNKYDAVIANPPYLRILKNDKSALAMPSVIHGAPNLYFLFASMSLFNLKNQSEMVYIIPRSWTSGEYFKAFRKYLLSDGKIEQVHLFVSRDKVFSQEQVLQETIILKIKKTKESIKTVKITSSQSNFDFNNITNIDIPYNSIVAGKSFYVFLPTNEEEIETIKRINNYSSSLLDIGYRMRTGIVVDFRQKEELREKPSEHTVPLFYSQHIKNGRVNHEESGNDYDWIIDSKQSLIQPNENYVFCKRFTAKEEKRRLQCGVYLFKDFPDYKYIGTQNKINYVNRLDDSPLESTEAFGLYALLNTTLFDQYYRILNGSTQVNSSEINSMPFPPSDIIKSIGQKLMDNGDLSTEACNKIVNEIAYYE